MSNNVGTLEIGMTCATCDADYVAEVEFDHADYNGNGIIEIEITEANCRCEPFFNGDAECDVEEAVLTGAR